MNYKEDFEMTVEMIRSKDNINDQFLHEKKQSGELYKWKEQYKKDKLPEYYAVSKESPLYQVFDHICSNMHIEIEKNERFVYSLDYIYLLDEVRGHQFGNLTPDYITFVKKGLDGLRINKEDSLYAQEYNATIDSIKTLIKRTIELINEQNTNNKEIKRGWFEKMIESPTVHFEEALQRVLFVNQIMWQTDHRLIGIGRLDSYLYEYYLNDINSGYISQDDAQDMVEDFILTLHQYYWLKSNMLMGDTGQIIVLGGSSDDGTYIYDDLTKIIINTITKLSIPDPKILLRVNKNIPGDILGMAFECIATGIGSPLLSNDEEIIPRLLAFGVDKEDALNYTVSACWEPLIGGKSISLNNMTTLNFMRPMENLFKRDKLSKISSFEMLVDRYEFYLEKNMRAVKRVIDGAIFQYDTVMSVFTDGCKERDASQGGAKYFNAGITTVALGNVIDSLLNIKKYVFDEGKYTLLDIKRMITFDFSEQEKLLQELKSADRKFGDDDDEVIALSKRIIQMVTKYTKDYKTPYGGRLKFGLSAPTYIDAAVGSLASFDGRQSGEPYLVHISNDSIKSYTQLLNFSAALDYGENRFNGNVVDIMSNPGFISQNIDKLKNMIWGAIQKGFFQLQMNVVSSSVLIDAMVHPEKHQGLIVRVWGFSAYFNDLPDSYKKNLIERALRNERRSVV